MAAIGFSLISNAAVQAQTRPAEPKPTEAPKAQPGAPDTTTDTFGDWAVVCGSHPSGTGEKICEVDATLTVRGQPSPIAKIAFARQAKDKPLRIIALVPVNVSFHKGVRIDLEPGKSGVDLAYKSCVPAACIGEAELSAAQLQAFRSPPASGQLTFEDATGKPMQVQFSYKGLDQALESFLKR